MMVLTLNKLNELFKDSKTPIGLEYNPQENSVILKGC